MRQSMRWMIVVAGGLAFPAVAQEEPAVPAVGEAIEVRVVNVEAVVTGASGERVRGLAAADFRLLVDGREVPIEYFSEVMDGTAAAGEEVGQSYLVYLDDSFSLANRRNDLLEKLERDLTLLRPVDRMAVLAFDGAHVETLCGWTGDRDRLRTIFQMARQRPALGGRMLAHQAALQADVDWIKDNAASFEAEEVVAILEALSHRISPEARTQLGRTAGMAAAALRGFETPPGRKVLFFMSAAWSLSVEPELYGPLLEAANRLGYTLYPTDASLSDAPLVTALDDLARATGGRVMVSAKNDAFRQVVADAGTYYGIGFTPTWKADDRSHAITVEVRRPGLHVRSRAGFADKSPSTETARRAESVLLFGGPAEDRRLIVELGAPVRHRKSLDVPVMLGVPVEALALQPQGTGYLAEVPLAVAAADENGRRADLPALRLQAQMATVPPARTYARFRTVLALRETPQQLVFTVRDPVTGRVLWGRAEIAPDRGGK